jgi:hypothetical protein
MENNRVKYEVFGHVKKSGLAYTFGAWQTRRFTVPATHSEVLLSKKINRVFDIIRDIRLIA